MLYLPAASILPSILTSLFNSIVVFSFAPALHGNDLPLEYLSAGANPTWPTTTGNRGEDLYESTDAFTLGGDKSSGNHYKGRIEEVVVYNKCLYPVVPSDNEFIFTKAVTEIVDTGKEGAPKVYTGRLFMKDYHNIRGSTSKQVATSAPVSFKKAGFRLK